MKMDNKAGKYLSKLILERNRLAGILRILGYDAKDTDKYNDLIDLVNQLNDIKTKIIYILEERGIDIDDPDNSSLDILIDKMSNSSIDYTVSELGFLEFIDPVNIVNRGYPNYNNFLKLQIDGLPCNEACVVWLDFTQFRNGDTSVDNLVVKQNTTDDFNNIFKKCEIHGGSYSRYYNAMSLLCDENNYGIYFVPYYTYGYNHTIYFIMRSYKQPTGEWYRCMWGSKTTVNDNNNSCLEYHTYGSAANAIIGITDKTNTNHTCFSRISSDFNQVSPENEFHVVCLRLRKNSQWNFDIFVDGENISPNGYAMFANETFGLGCSVYGEPDFILNTFDYLQTITHFRYTSALYKHISHFNINHTDEEVVQMSEWLFNYYDLDRYNRRRHPYVDDYDSENLELFYDVKAAVDNGGDSFMDLLRDYCPGMHTNDKNLAWLDHCGVRLNNFYHNTCFYFFPPDMTIELLFSINDMNDLSYMTDRNNGYWLFNIDRFGFYMRNIDGNGPNVYLAAYTGSWFTVDNKNPINAGELIHVQGTFSSTEKIIKFYINGEFYDQTSVSGNIVYHTGVAFIFGKNWHGNNWYVNARYHCARVYSRVLEADELLSNYLNDIERYEGVLDDV
jgi:hypothetical protein